MGKRSAKRVSFPVLMFHVPDNASLQFNPGKQIYSPGEAAAAFPNPGFNPIPWPNMVPSILGQMLSHNVGIARSRGAMQSQVNQYAPLFENYLFLANQGEKG